MGLDIKHDLDGLMKTIGEIAWKTLTTDIT